MREFTHEELLALVKKVRCLAWYGYSDSRTKEEYAFYLNEILRATKEIGNDY